MKTGVRVNTFTKAQRNNMSNLNQYERIKFN